MTVYIVDGKLPCNDCKQLLPISCFTVNRARKCGYKNICRDCSTNRKATWREANRDRVADYQAAWRAANAEHLAEYERRRYEADPEFHRQRVVASRQSDEGRRKRALWQQNRVARAKGIENTLTDTEWQAIVEKYGGRCLACGRADLPLTRDHVIPLAKGGALTADNTQPLCGPCNSSKKTKVIDYRPDRPAA